MRWAVGALLMVITACQPSRKDTVVAEVEELPVGETSAFGPEKLSEHGLYTGAMKELRPSSGVYEYEINSPLFSDYAFKKRFVKIPEGSRMTYQPREVFDFPEGTVLVKNFYYPADIRKPSSERRLLETRLLTLNKGSWEPLTYIWNADQTEALLEIAGRVVQASWIHSDGILRSTEYSVPDVNQCRGCHLKGDRAMPIGPSARQLNRDGQLERWSKEHLLSGLPESADIPRLVSYDDTAAKVPDRARAWLESNCAHCHRPDGQAKTSGLHLAADVTSALELGVGKAPVAAGKGSGGRRFSLVPGKPDESILYYRIVSTDPGVMMPEMGRKLVHEEGVELVRQWILTMPRP